MLYFSNGFGPFLSLFSQIYSISHFQINLPQLSEANKRLLGLLIVSSPTAPPANTAQRLNVLALAVGSKRDLTQILHFLLLRELLILFRMFCSIIFSIKEEAEDFIVLPWLVSGPLRRQVWLTSLKPRGLIKGAKWLTAS